MTATNNIEEQPQDGSYSEGKPSAITPQDAEWKPFTVFTRGGIDNGKGKFWAFLEGAYTSNDTAITLKTTRYRMSGPYEPKNRANINVKITQDIQQKQHNSPDTLKQDDVYHPYEVTLTIPRVRDYPPSFNIGIEVDFDGPDGGGWFWTWWTKEL